MSKIALLESSKLTSPVPGREVKVVWAHRETPVCRSGNAKQVPSHTPPLAVRLRAHLASLTALETAALFTLVNRQNTDEHTLLKCAAGEIGVSEALIVKIAKKLGFEGFRQLREALGEHHRVSQAERHEELCGADGTSDRLQKVLRASVRALEEGLTRVSPEALERAADCLHAARQRDFYGEGGSGQMARDASYQFLRIGVRTSVFNDGQLMLMSAALLRRGDDGFFTFGPDGSRAGGRAPSTPKRSSPHRLDQPVRLAAGPGIGRGALCQPGRFTVGSGKCGGTLGPAQRSGRAPEHRGPERLRRCSGKPWPDHRGLRPEADF
jgi:hypothetical protein